MASEISHIELANKTHGSMMALVADFQNHPEWIATTAFYKALHVVEAVFMHQEGRSCNDHNSRLRRLNLPKYGAIYVRYHALWNSANVARYLCDKDPGIEYSTFTDYLTPHQVIDEMLKKRLNRVEQLAVTLLSTNAAKLLKKLHHPDLP
jgi:hypothetical protein